MIWGQLGRAAFGGEVLRKRARDLWHFDNIQKRCTVSSKKHLHDVHLPRLCELPEPRLCRHLPRSGAIYSVKEDGIVLIDGDKCQRGWRLCIGGCPYKNLL
ncbi:hypothetical protein KCP75_07425 [Salmonella enterica subsp. enterica]|nr:hypothetical protein KCP75_07425 [Salmonella enterica subsp. enterica]